MLQCTNLDEEIYDILLQNILDGQYELGEKNPDGGFSERVGCKLHPCSDRFTSSGI